MIFRIAKFLVLLLLVSIITTIGVRLLDTRAQTEARKQATPPSNALAQPPTWVPFQADVTITGKDSQDVVGRFYRSSDGSTRLETRRDRSQPPETGAISIHNIPASLHYERTAVGPWVSRPMVLPPDGWKPDRYLAGRGGMAASPLTQKIENLEVYQQRNDKGGVVFLRAPALNFFAVVQQNAVHGIRWSYTNIKLGEPDKALFVPPPGSEVDAKTEPGGIVWNPNPDEPVR